MMMMNDDDTTLLVSEHTDTELEVEFNHIKAWAAANCLHLNLSKTKEVVFRQPRITYFHLPPAVGDIEQVNCFKLLGVIFQSDLKMDSHVHYIIIDVETRDLQIWLSRLCMAVRAMAVHRLMSWVLWTDE